MTRPLHRAFDDRPISFWLRGLGVIVIVSFALSGYAVIKQSEESSARNADRKAQAFTQVGQCFQARRNAPGVIAALELIDTLADNSIKTNRAALAQPTAAADPLTPVRVQALRRLLPAQGELHLLIATTKSSVPSKAKCDDLARSLGVNPTKIK